MTVSADRHTDPIMRIRERIPGIPADILSYVQHLEERLNADPRPGLTGPQLSGHLERALSGFSRQECIAWLAIGRNLSGQSGSADIDFFSSDPRPLAELQKTDRRAAFSVLDHLSKIDAPAALSFYADTLGRLGRIHPDMRADLVAFARSLSGAAGMPVDRVFSLLLDAFGQLSLRRQEIAMQEGRKIAQHSREAAMCFFKHLPENFAGMDEKSFIRWVENGLALSAHEAGSCSGYFGLTTSKAAEAFNCHRNAVWLENVSEILSLYARALSGKTIRFKAGAPSVSAEMIHPEKDGYVFQLPPCIAETESPADNFRFYKVMTARLAGYIEFGDYENGIFEITEHLDRLRGAPLARSIFTIIENARIDLLLMRQYPGLHQDINIVRDDIRRSRPALSSLRNTSALLEMIYRMSIARFESERTSEMYVHFADRACRIIEAFLAQTPALRDSYRVTVELYGLIRRFFADMSRDRPEDGLPPDSAQGGGPAVLPGGKQIPDAAEDRQPDEVDPDMLMTMEAFPDLTENWKNLAVQGVQAGGHDLSGRYITEMSGLTDSPRSDDDPEFKSGAGILSDAGSRVHREDAGYVYDEWDFQIRGFRRRWCRLVEKPAPPRDSCRLNRVLVEYDHLIREVKSQFQRIRPRVFDIVRHVDAGDELDISALVNAMVAKKTGRMPDDAVYIRKQRRKQSVRLIFLVDMSASTDEKAKPAASGGGSDQAEKRIIDIEIESLIVMTEALYQLDFTYAIYGFSGYGRQAVEVYRIKGFNDADKMEIQQRICGIRPLRGTRMGTAVRHATRKFDEFEDEFKILLLLSDGYPQDVDYGEDRRSSEYGLHDTMMAIQEARIKGIAPFCLTFNHSGTDYLKVMQDPTRYLALADTYMLPQILPRVVESLMMD